MNNIQSGISARLKALRESNGLTQKEAGDLLGVTPAAYGKIESGDRGLSSEYCIALADHFGVSCDFILRGVESEFADICSKTYLSPEAVNFLVQDREQRNKELSTFNECMLKANSLRDEYCSAAKETKPADASLLDAADVMFASADSKWGYLIQSRAFYCIINALIRDADFHAAIGRAGVKAWEGIVNSQRVQRLIDEIDHPTSERSMIQLLEMMAEKDDALTMIDAAQYVASRAFSRFFEALCNDPTFIQSLDPELDD